MQIIHNLPINIKNNMYSTTNKLPSYSTHNTYNHRNLGINHETNKIINAIGVVFLLIIMSIAFIRGIDSRIESQDIMLCESALVSKNPEYLRKCQCYYQSNDIKCLQSY